MWYVLAGLLGAVVGVGGLWLYIITRPTYH